MGDDDIICLSSDDESTTEKLPPKRSKVVLEPPTKTETESPLHHKINLKRISSHDRADVLPKRPKIDTNDSLEEITIESPQKCTNRESKTKNDKSKERAELSNSMRNSIKEISLNNSSRLIFPDENSKLSRNPNSKIQDVPGKCSIPIDISVSSDHNKVSNNIKSHTTVSDPRSKAENNSNEVRNIYAKNSQSNHSKSSTSRTLQVGDKRKTDNPEIPAPIGQRIETQKIGPSNTQIDRGASKIAEKSRDVRSSLPSVKSLHIINATETGSTKNAIENVLRKVGSVSPRLSKISSMKDQSNIKIVQEVTKSSSTTKEKNLNGVLNRSPKINDRLPICSNSSSPVSTLLPNERNNGKIALPKSDSLKISDNSSVSLPTKNCRTSHDITKSSDVEIIVDTVKTPVALSSTIESNTDGKKSSKARNDRSINEISSPSPISRGIVEEVSSKATEFGKSLKNSEIPKALSLKNMTEKTLMATKRLSLKSSDIRTTPTCPKSPEVEIVRMIEVPKSSSRPASDKIPNGSGKLNSISVNGESSKESSKKPNATISRTSVTSETGSSRNTHEKDSKRHENDAKMNTSNSGSREKNFHMGNSPIVDSAKIDGKREEKSSIDKLQSSSTNSESVKKRITPQLLSDLNESRKKSDGSVSNISDDQDDKESSGSKERPKAKKFVLTLGRSEIPDAKFPSTTENSKKTSSSRIDSIEKSSNHEDVREMKKSALESRNNEPQAGCSKSSDELDHFEKPYLVVKTKKAVNQDEQDTFAMFLSLCLQTDRTPAMEKVVAKLKRLYDQMNPEYVKSKVFRTFLDEKREKIISKGKAYYWIGQVVEEMKLRKKRDKSSIRKKDETTENDEDEAKASNDENEEEEDPEESRRLRNKIRTIEKAMKQCTKRIHELEIAEVDFDDENNSHYIKLDRYKEKMIELYTKMCEYTKEHADAGRAYLRPKHLRVSQIPSINQAISNFINSKLSYNRKKGMKKKSFVDGLIFPDYVDILECVGKVNEQQNLGLNKRKQQQLAEDAFTQLGKHLQESRQKDYWDTFSLHLENSEDPATADPVLCEKLIQNQEIAEKKTKAIFEEYVRKQDERSTENYESTSSASDQEEDDDDDDNDDGNDVENDVKESSRIVDSEVESSDDKENDHRSEKDDEDNEHENKNGDDHRSGKEKNDTQDSSRSEKNDDRRSGDDNEEVASIILETIPEVSSPKSVLDDRAEKTDDQVAEVTSKDDKIQGNNNILTTKLRVAFSPTERAPTENSTQDEAGEVEVNLAEVYTDDVIEADVTTKTIEGLPSPLPSRPLRIRSFAKPPSSWLNSQEEVVEIPNDLETSKNTETIDVLDADPTIETSSEIETCSTNLAPRNFTNEGDLMLGNRPVVIRPNNIQSSKIENARNQASIIPRSSIKLSQNQQSANLTKVRVDTSNDSGQSSRQLTAQPGKYGEIGRLPLQQSNSLKTKLFPVPRHSIVPTTVNTQAPRISNLTTGKISQISQGAKVPQKIRISTSTTNPANVRLQVISTKGSQQINGQTIPVPTIKQMKLVRLPEGNSLTRVSNPQIIRNSQLPTKSSNATGQMRYQMPKVVQSSRTSDSQQIRPQISTVGNTRIINSSQAQIVRFNNGQRTAPLTVGPRDTSPMQQRLLPNVVATSTSTKNLENSTILLTNRIMKVPATNAASSPELSQLRIERIENLPQRSLRLSNNESSSSTTLTQIVSTGQRVIPVLKPRTNENVPTIEQDRSGKR